MSNSVVDSDPEILGGTPVFVGTRVPAKALIDSLEGGHSLAEFLEDFPTVKREQAIASNRTFPDSRSRSSCSRRAATTSRISVRSPRVRELLVGLGPGQVVRVSGDVTS